MSKVVRSIFFASRPVNLVIIVLAMMATRYGILQSLISPFELQSSNVQFYILVLSTVLIAAAGNLINDYFDTKIDSINHPKKMIVGVSLKPVWAIAGHLVFSSIGIILGAWVAWQSGMWYLALFPLIASFILWFYSASAKRTLLVGNVLVALLAGSVIMEVGLFEINQLRFFYLADLYKMLDGNPNGYTPEGYFNILWLWVASFAFFAFWYNIIREILKDWQDMKGDSSVNSQTFPLVFGVPATRVVLIVLLIFGLAFLGGMWFVFLGDSISGGYFGLIFLLTGGVYYFLRGSSLNLAKASLALKLIMVMGILFGGIIRFILV
jgi:4-hydroxybenzoate polyprenyltransferase